MSSSTWWTWVWVNSGSWWWTGRPGVLQSTVSQRVGHDWATELNWTIMATTYLLTKEDTNMKISSLYDNYKSCFVLVFQSLNGGWLFAAPWIAVCQAPLSFTISLSLLKLMSIESVMFSNHLILCHPHLLWHSIFPSIRVFPNESALSIRWPKYWSFSFSISPSNEYSGLNNGNLALTGLISLQSKGFSRVFFNTTIWKHKFFSPLSCPYSPTLTSTHDYWKNHSFDYMDLFLAKWCLCFLIYYLSLSQLSFLPPKEQASFNFMAAVTIHSDFGKQGNKLCHLFYFSPFCLPWSDGTGCHDLRFYFLNVEF